MLEYIKRQFREQLPHAWVSLLGLGVVQAWLSMMMLEVTAAEGAVYNRTHLVSDIGSVFAYLIVAVFAGRMAPLFEKRRACALSVLIMIAGNAIVAASVIAPPLPAWVSEVGLAVAGCGAAFLMVCWLELYAMLNPKEVAFYYAGSQVIKEAVLALMLGYVEAYQLALSFAMPLVAAAMLQAGARRAAKEGMGPVIRHGAISFPWKPLLLMGLYSFAYGCGTWLASYTNDAYMHLGILLPALIVCASVVFPRGSFDFAAIYRIILPISIASLLVLLVIPRIPPNVATLFVQSSFTAVLIYAAILLCNLSRRYHVSAAWLFSLLNVVHIVCLGIGTLVFLSLPFMFIIVVCIMCILLVTFIIVSEPTLSSDWNIVLANKGGCMDEETRIEIAVDSLAKQHDLSVREKEVLALLAHGDMPRTIGSKLHIAPGTVKAHMQHIYKKIGIHSKEELMSLLEE